MRNKPSFLKRHALDIIAVLVLIVLFSLVSSCDMLAQENERDEYCDMVESKLWPDYRDITGTECSEKKDGSE